MSLRIFQVGSHFDGVTKYQVMCPKHKEYIPFQLTDVQTLSVYDVQRIVDETALKAIDAWCKGCAKDSDVVVLPPTRWPNAGEPGGAEL